ncbi:hypothetical protein ST47_g10220 [Ascochyta rabiei]|uniref:Uncharacterized protein n=2 Tax=Didymella rabiei TaxID=5454 RepID=A0A162VT58_DIDRA|nr:hypothetical protein ST47_g10220 [Ascochyta rabiei]
MVSNDLALSIAVPVAVGVVLIVAILLVPKGFFSYVASKIYTASCNSNTSNSTRRWFGRHAQNETSSMNEKSQPTFVEQHLGMLRAWQKPTKYARHLQPVQPTKPGDSHQPFRLTGMSFRYWQEFQRNASVRCNPMHEFKVTGEGVKSPAYWTQVGKEIEARKSWWEIIKA